ncbi:MAG: hypothetical protein HN348_35750, partial [Proteobacteria bacterium]|jgi:hypothetical protein|nr:hypothetical protein [Pseudomonadota bacterium]
LYNGEITGTITASAADQSPYLTVIKADDGDLATKITIDWTVETSLVEVCGDGYDNDQDGLVDCEDGDCFDQCDEICDDQQDNDNDGLVDRDDTDDCPCADTHCGMSIQVLGGQMERLEQDKMTRGTVPPNYIQIINTYVDTMTAENVWGIVQVAPPGKLWNTTSARTSCTWSVDTVEARELYITSSLPSFGVGVVLGVEQVDNVTRTGFAIEPGCRLSTSGFLPNTLVIEDQLAEAGNFAGYDTLTRVHHSWEPTANWYIGSGEPGEWTDGVMKVDRSSIYKSSTGALDEGEPLFIE